jgi:hypothetical protein
MIIRSGKSISAQNLLHVAHDIGEIAIALIVGESVDCTSEKTGK